MSRGDVYLHSNFPFSDGTFGKKYFVIVFEPKPESKEPYLILKTTSKLKIKFIISDATKANKPSLSPAKM
jgi:hypothetical protein